MDFLNIGINYCNVGMICSFENRNDLLNLSEKVNHLTKSPIQDFFSGLCSRRYFATYSTGYCGLSLAHSERAWRRIGTTVLSR